MIRVDRLPTSQDLTAKLSKAVHTPRMDVVPGVPDPLAYVSSVPYSNVDAVPDEVTRKTRRRLDDFIHLCARLPREGHTHDTTSCGWDTSRAAILSAV